MWNQERLGGKLEALTLEQRGQAVATARTDAYGDFRFGGLDVDSGAYRLTIADERFAPASIDVELRGESVYLRDIALAPRPAAAPEATRGAAPHAVPLQ